MSGTVDEYLYVIFNQELAKLVASWFGLGPGLESFDSDDPSQLIGEAEKELGRFWDSGVLSYQLNEAQLEAALSFSFSATVPSSRISWLCRR